MTAMVMLLWTVIHHGEHLRTARAEEAALQEQGDNGKQD
jgi:hypothetical protein